MNCTRTVPFSQDLLRDLGSLGKGLVISCGLATLITLAVSCSTIWTVRKNTEDVMERYMYFCLIAVFPVVGVTCLVGIISPLSSNVDDFVASLYISISMVVFFQLILHLHRGEEKLCRTLNGVKVNLAGPPCCCFFCFRHVRMNRTVFFRLKVLVCQMIVSRPVILYIDAVLKAEQLTRNPAFYAVTVLSVLTSFLGLFGLISTYRISHRTLKSHRIAAKFALNQVGPFLYDAQGSLLRFIVSAGVLPCTDLFYHPARAETFSFVVISFEMCLLSILGRWQFGKKTAVYTNQKAKEAIETVSETV